MTCDSQMSLNRVRGRPYSIAPQSVGGGGGRTGRGGGHAIDG